MINIKLTFLPMENHLPKRVPSRLTTDTAALESFLREDLGYGDISSNVIDPDLTGAGEIFTKEDCVLAGAEEADWIFRYLGLSTKTQAKDGQSLKNLEQVLTVTGNVRGILAGERVALNIISRMSGIATLTHTLVSMTRNVNPHLRIACSRKTTPGFRFFEKKAVIIGGGDPHRFRLDDCIMLKDNHLKRMGSLEEGITKAKSFSFSKKVEVEVESIETAERAAAAGADIIMLDNMSPEEVRKGYLLIKNDHPHITIEVSGGITPENIMEYAKYADVISLGFLTHSYRSIDFSLELKD